MTQAISYGDPAIRITLLPRDTNPQGTIFGGIILSYIDIAGAVEAHRHTGIERFVTVAMREVVYVAVDANRRKMKINKNELRGGAQSETC